MSNLNIDRSRGTAPHKPLLLLLICQLVEEGRLTDGVLHRDGALAFRFASWWRVVADRRRTRPDVRLPFFHLKSDGVWDPLDAAGNVTEFRERAVQARLDVSFLACLQDAAFRELARRTLIARYFEPAERAELYSLCGLPVPSEDEMAADATRYLRSDTDARKRDAKFAARVLPAYDFTCALTRHRLIAIDGSTPLDAAHIHQFKRGGPCHPTNGMALSKTAHWLFDHGYWSLTDDGRVMVAAHRFHESGERALLLKPRAGEEILLPRNPALRPDPACLRWHRERFGFAA